MLTPQLIDSFSGTQSTGGTASYTTIKTTVLAPGTYMVNAFIKHYNAPNGDPDPGELRVTIPGVSQDAFPWKVRVLEDDSTYENRQEANNLFVIFRVENASSCALEQRTPDPDAGGIGAYIYYSCWKVSD